MNIENSLGLRIAKIWKELVEYLNRLSDQVRVGTKPSEITDELEAPQ